MILLNNLPFHLHEPVTIAELAQHIIMHELQVSFEHTVKAMIDVQNLHRKLLRGSVGDGIGRRVAKKLQTAVGKPIAANFSERIGRGDWWWIG